MQIASGHSFSAEQQQVLNIIEGEHLVLAPPGSGKTELLAARVELALNREIAQEDMICLTFTNRAAKGMKARVKKMNPQAKILIGNIHHFSIRFLTNNKILPPYVSLIDEADADLLLDEAIDITGFNVENERGRVVVTNNDLFKLNAYLKQRRLGFPEKVLVAPDPVFPDPGAAEQVCTVYAKLKKESDLVDLDDLLIYTYYHLMRKKVPLTMCQYKWLQLDEAQDLNPLQWGIIEMITHKDCNKVFFGDYEQSIFSFMGSKPDQLHALEKRCTVHNLHTNFRSPKYLLDLYVTYARTNLDPRWTKEPIALKNDAPDADALMMFEVNGPVEAEADMIARSILPNYLGKSTTSTNAILVRSNKTAELISTVLKKHQHIHFKISGFDLFKRAPIKHTMAYLNCLENIYDKFSWARLFWLYSFETLKAARHFIKDAFVVSLNPAEFLEDAFNTNWQQVERYTDIQKEFFTKYEKYILKFIKAFGPIWKQHRQFDKVMALDQLIEEFVNYNRKYFPSLKDFEEKKMEDYPKWKRHIQETCEARPIVELLELYVTEYRLFKESDLLLGDERIIISTVHKAKGLEFENVIVAECVSGCYPFWSSRKLED